MNARMLMTPRPTVVTPEDSIVAAAAAMRDYDVGLLPVVTDLTERRLVGVLTDRDIVLRCVSEDHELNCTVADHMTTGSLGTVMPDDGVGTVAETMERFQVRRLPVVDEDYCVVGIIAQADLARKVGPEDPTLMEHVLASVSTPGATVS
jgi:CBS domain-containing protein